MSDQDQFLRMLRPGERRIAESPGGAESIPVGPKGGGTLELEDIVELQVQPVPLAGNQLTVRLAGPRWMRFVFADPSSWSHHRTRASEWIELVDAARADLGARRGVHDEHENRPDSKRELNDSPPLLSVAQQGPAGPIRPVPVSHRPAPPAPHTGRSYRWVWWFIAAVWLAATVGVMIVLRLQQAARPVEGAVSRLRCDGAV